MVSKLWNIIMGHILILHNSKMNFIEIAKKRILSYCTSETLSEYLRKIHILPLENFIVAEFCSNIIGSR